MSDMEDFITHSTSGTHILFELLLLPTKSHGGDVEQPRHKLHTRWVCITAEGPMAKVPGEGNRNLYSDYKQT